ncbi:MAG: Smr/MutS family protein [Caulobacteraceae bacterium]
MSRKQRDLTTDEKKLWRRVAASVKKARRPLPPEPDETLQQGASKGRDADALPQAAPAARRSNAPPPAPQDRRNEKRVRRGNLKIGGQLDLHGHTQDTARAALRRFLRAAQRRGNRTVIVITGAGRGGEGVLKERLPEWLGEGEIAALVAGYAPAHRSHGGAGAFYVFLRRGD